MFGSMGLPAFAEAPEGGAAGGGAPGGAADNGVPADPGASGAGSQEGMPGVEGAETMPDEKPISPADFKKFQSQADKRAAELQRQAQDNEQAAMAALAYIQQLEAKLTELQMAGATPEQIEAVKSKQQLEYEKLALEQEKQKLLPAVRKAALLEISEQYDVPMEELADAKTRAEAELIAKAYKKYRRQVKLEERAAKGTDKQEGSSPAAGVDLSGIKDSRKLLEMAFARR